MASQAPEQRSWCLTYHSRPWTHNTERGRGGTRTGHWSYRAALTKEWREAFFILAKKEKVPHMDAIHVDVYQSCKKGRMPDTGACAPAVKAAVDGLVDANVILDDTHTYVKSIRYWAPEKDRDKEDCLTLRISDASLERDMGWMNDGE